MAYKLNDILLSDYGIVASQAPSSNIALAGCFDMPIRRGDLFYEWGDENGVEAYVDEDDLMFDGREIIFYGIMLGSRAEVEYNLKSLYYAINKYSSTIELETPYGTFNVLVSSVSPVFTNEATNIQITFREPIVDLTGGAMPSVGTSDTTIKGVPLIAYGLYFSKSSSQLDLSDMKEQYFTSYETEGFQVSKRKANTIIFDGFIIGSSLSDFQDKVRNLYALYTSTGVGIIKLSNLVYKDCFPTNGFSISDIIIHGNGVIARFNSEFTISTNSDVIITDDLVFHLDAGDINSYPRTGVTWYDLALSNNGTLNDVDYVDRAMEFDGSSSYVDCGNDESLKIDSEIVIGAWIKPYSANDGNIVSKNFNDGFRLRIDSSGALWFYVGAVLCSGGTIPLNEWSYVVAIGTQSFMAIYINNVYIKGVASAYSPTDVTTGNLIIGKGLTEVFDGLIADVHIYNNYISSATIRYNYNSNKLRYQ